MTDRVIFFVLLLWYSVLNDHGVSACPTGKPKICHCLGYSVYCERGLQRNIPWKEFPKWVELISLRQIYDLEKLSLDVMPTLPKLRQLNISNCRKLVSLHGDVAAKMPKLDLLRITQSSLKTSPFFSSTSYSLQTLIINSNNLTRLDKRTNAAFPLLRHLEVNNNKLVEIRSSWFRPDNYIQYLSANGNAIWRLDSDLGIRLSRLRVLRLNKNRVTRLLAPPKHRRAGTIRGIPEGNVTVLPSMPSVRRLELARNRMKNIGSLAFYDWKELKVLVLRKNFLHTPETGAFYVDGGGLSKLDITGNPKITKLVRQWTYGLDQLTELVAARCGIREIDPDALGTIGTSLQHLDLSANKLTKLSPSLWKTLTKLRTLKLAGNGVDRLPPTAFDGLGQLRELSLMANSLTSLTPVTKEGAPVLAKSAFDPLGNLTSLDLSYNRLQRLHAIDLRAQSQKLVRLVLSGNNLSRIEAKALTQLSGLTSLRMDTTRLFCDCQTLRLVPWLAASIGRSSGVRGTNCSQPPAVTNLPLMRLTTKADRVCSPLSKDGKKIFTPSGTPKKHEDDPIAVGITRVSPVGNTTVVLLRGATLSLKCVATVPLTDETNGAPGLQLDFRWTRMAGQLPINLSKKTDRRVSVTTRSNNGGRQLISELRISPVAVRDTGQYRCMFSGASARFQASVLVSPYFTERPRSLISAMAGETVTIPCAAAGVPPPQSSLRMRGGIEFPAAKDQRLSIVQGDASIMMRNVKQIDAGEYVCECYNDGGVVSQPFTLRVNQIPGLLPEPAPRQLLEEGRPEFLACMATGWPFPRIRWLRNGQPLDLPSSVADSTKTDGGIPSMKTELGRLTRQRSDEKNATLLPYGDLRKTDGQDNRRLHLSQRDQTLVFREVKISDAGVYLCRLWNAIGRKEARIVVDVRDSTGRIYPGANASGLPEHGPTNWVLSNMTGIVVIAVVSCIVVTSILWVAALFCLKRRLRRKACARAASLVLASGDATSLSHRSLPRSGAAVTAPLASSLASSIGRLSASAPSAPLLSSSIYITSLSGGGLSELEMGERMAMLSAGRQSPPSSFVMTTSFRSPVDSAVEEDACSTAVTVHAPPTSRSRPRGPVLRPVGGADVPSSGYNSGNSDYSVGCGTEQRTGGWEDSSSGERLSVHSSSSDAAPPITHHRLNIPCRSASEEENEDDDCAKFPPPPPPPMTLVTSSVILSDHCKA